MQRFRHFMSVQVASAILGVFLLSACSLGTIQENTNIDIVPTTNDTFNDASSAAQFVPDFDGYISTDAVSVAQALGGVAGGGSLLTGNVPLAALVAQIDSMIGCYRGVGAVAAKVYVQADVASVIQGQIPTVGTLAVINTDRLVNNFLSCAVGGLGGLSAQAAEVQICSSSGSFTVNGETLAYLAAATNPAFCSQLIAAIPQG